MKWNLYILAAVLGSAPILSQAQDIGSVVSGTYDRPQRRQQPSNNNNSGGGFWDLIPSWGTSQGNNGAVTPTGATQMNEIGAGEQRTEFINFAKQSPKNLPIVIRKASWTQADENLYAQFIHKLGKAVRAKKCNRVSSCMKSPEANMFASTDPRDLVIYSDCADLPYVMRAYFAWKNGLPFRYVSEARVLQRPASSPADKDILLPTATNDSSPYGNFIVRSGGTNLMGADGVAKQFLPHLMRVMDGVSTRVFRVGPMAPNEFINDVYAVSMNRRGIGPGTIVHSTGHIYVVYDIEDNGTIRMIDAHPDGSISEKIVKESTLDRSRPDHGLGFFRFRPVSVVGAVNNGDQLVGGSVKVATDQQLVEAGLLSLEQWFGPGSQVKPWEPVEPTAYKRGYAPGKFFEILKKNMLKNGTTIKADIEVKDLIESLCQELMGRKTDVEAAIKAGLTKKAHPATLPSNIFSTTETDWEAYSTPGRDGRLRASVAGIVRAAVAKWQSARTEGSGVTFAGNEDQYIEAVVTHLKKLGGLQDESGATLLEKDAQGKHIYPAQCSVTYTKSNGQKKILALGQMLNRLNKMSFDPYHCPEKRWGATGEELASCVDGDSGNQWYNAQAMMRNYQGKVTETEQLVIRSNTAITLSMLGDARYLDQPDTAAINLGYTKAPVMNLTRAFQSPRFKEMLQGAQ